jgi:hypothetical protein
MKTEKRAKYPKTVGNFKRYNLHIMRVQEGKEREEKEKYLTQ